ncbi:hypothetical protein BGZ60DRAFT_534862 [Tricladium varicosporioides]|nr:hypothetical protein BGZ60DRAFT_534862 [Hymenoscyphus varicosporioides]
MTTISITPLTNLPRSFQCSDDQLNQIWLVGARTIQETQVPAGTTPEFYQISDQGLFAESQSPQTYSSDTAPGLMQYQLESSVKPIVGGFGYTVLSNTLGSDIYIFVNIDNSSISAHISSTERDSAPLSIDDQLVSEFTQTSALAGSFGLGASFRHTAYYQNLTLKSLEGQEIYSSTLTEKSALDDFPAGTNSQLVSVDGARRDRIAYAGDLDIALGPTFASTFGSEYINGTINLFGAAQFLPGFFVPNSKIQQKPRTAVIQANQTDLIGYFFSMVTAMADFYLMTGDIKFANRWSPAITKMLNWADSQRTPESLSTSLTQQLAAIGTTTTRCNLAWLRNTMPCTHTLFNRFP